MSVPVPAPQGSLDRPVGTFGAGSRQVAPSWVVDFEAGSREMRELLGGKGANVAEMTRVLGAERVPAGFTVTTEACVAYMHGDGALPERPARAGARLARAARRRARAGRLRETPPTRCSSRCARARASRCPGCWTRS